MRVRETVPDSIFDRADSVELVDLTPEDLISRLKEGKVYVPKQAERALEHFFSPANLTALRELALRRTAERVDEQLLTQMQARAIAGPWAGRRARAGLHQRGPARRRAWSATPSASPIACMRRGRRSTSSRRAACSLNEEQRDRIADTLRLAQSLEGEPVTIPGGGRRVADDVIGYAQANNITHIIIGKSSRSRWFEILHGSVVHDLVRGSGNISVHVIAGDELAAEPIPKKTVQTASSPDRLAAAPLLRLAHCRRDRARRRHPDPPLAGRRDDRPAVSDRDRRASPCASAFGRRWSRA